MEHTQAMPVCIKTDQSTESTKTSKERHEIKNTNSSFKKKLKTSKRKRFKLKRFLKTIFKKKKKDREPKIKNKWMRFSVKVFLIYLFVLVISAAILALTSAYPNTLIGSSNTLTDISYVLLIVSINITIIALASIIITAIILDSQG